MKFIIVSLLFIVTSFSVFSSTILTASDRKEILAIIDRTCADTWCEGDYDYKFLSFSCMQKTLNCTLRFKIIDLNSNARDKKCIFKNITSKDQIIYNHNLTEDFYDQLNECINNFEIPNLR